jgi:sugar lactone lactonase YvrE
VAVDSGGNLWVADTGNHRVLRFAASSLNNPDPPAADTVIGQRDFFSNGANRGNQAVTASGLDTPVGLAFDAQGNLWVADFNNTRVLRFAAPLGPGAPDPAASSVIGEPNFATRGVPPQPSNATLAGPAGAQNVLGQSDFATVTANSGISPLASPNTLSGPVDVKVDPEGRVYVADTRTAVANVDSRGSLNPTRTSLSSPAGIAVQPNTGALYVADSGNHRVLRFPRPVDQTGRITPAAVIGQLDFTSAISAVVSASSLRSPSAIAFGPDGDLFVADSGNNRVLEFATAGANQGAAVRVYGQPNFTTSSAPAQSSAQTLTLPQGLFVDSAFNLYVSDTGANRVLVFPNTQAAPPAGMAAAFVIGQARFDTTTAGGGGAGLRAPGGIAVDHAGNIYVADSGSNRVLEFSSLVFLPIGGATATAVIGQRDAGGIAANWNSPDGLATPEGLATPVSIYLDRQDTLYIADAGNSRVLHFLGAATTVNAATYQPSVAVPQGGIVAMFGGGIARGSAVAPGAPWPDTLVNRQVVVNDETPAPLYSGSDQFSVSDDGARGDESYRGPAGGHG